jgi:glycosyltransferase involved in cell wall biosynthesis
MRLLIFIYSLGNGGAERVTANLTNFWAKKGWEITIVTIAPLNLDFYELHPTVKRIALGLEGDSGNVLTGLWQNLHRIAAIRRILHQVQPNIALGMMTTSNVLLALGAFGIPAVRIVGSERIHPPQLPLGFLWEFLRCYTYGLLSAVTCMSSKGENWIKNHTHSKKVTVIPNSASWPLSVQEPQIKPFQNERHLLLTVGRLTEQKGFDLLIQAFSKLAQEHSDWDLVILGEGSLRSKLETQVQESGLQNRIFLLGQAGNVSEWYERADLYVLSSRFEGFPNSLVEAMAHGLPSVGFDCDTGPSDIIRHEQDGLLVESGNVNELTAALDRLMGDALVRKGFAERATEVRDRFSVESVAGMWEKLFEEIMRES